MAVEDEIIIEVDGEASSLDTLVIGGSKSMNKFCQLRLSREEARTPGKIEEAKNKVRAEVARVLKEEALCQ